MDVVAILNDPDYLVPAVDPPGPVGTVAWLRATVSRFSNGPLHARRRALVTERIDALDLDRLRAGVGAPVRILATETGVADVDADRVVEAVATVARAYHPGDVRARRRRGGGVAGGAAAGGGVGGGAGAAHRAARAGIDRHRDADLESWRPERATGADDQACRTFRFGRPRSHGRPVRGRPATLSGRGGRPGAGGRSVVRPASRHCTRRATRCCCRTRGIHASGARAGPPPVSPRSGPRASGSRPCSAPRRLTNETKEATYEGRDGSSTCRCYVSVDAENGF